jgi:hypothetical protein
MKTNKVLDSVIDIASFLQEETIYDLRGRQGCEYGLVH